MAALSHTAVVSEIISTEIEQRRLWDDQATIGSWQGMLGP